MEKTSDIFHHQMPAQLRFSDVDRFGHVNNSVYFSLFDMCKTRYFFDVVGKDIFEKTSTVIVHIDANFISPVYFPRNPNRYQQVGTQKFYCYSTRHK